MRVEHWATALNQPAVAAASMLGDRDAVYDELPYFYTDQYELGMEHVGHIDAGNVAGSGAGYDQMGIRGDTTRREFIACWITADRVVAGMAVNVWDVIEPIKTLIRFRTPTDTTRLADPALPLPTAAH